MAASTATDPLPLVPAFYIRATALVPSAGRAPLSHLLFRYRDTIDNSRFGDQHIRAGHPQVDALFSAIYSAVSAVWASDGVFLISGVWWMVERYYRTIR